MSGHTPGTGKPTPGPWAVGFSDGSGQAYITAGGHPALRRADEAVVVVVGGSEDSWGIQQGVRNPADARLIAAAPDLLDALTEMTELAAGPAGGVSQAQKVAILAKARAAIARATGEPA